MARNLFAEASKPVVNGRNLFQSSPAASFEFQAPTELVTEDVKALSDEERASLEQARAAQTSIYGTDYDAGPTAATRDTATMEAYRTQAPVDTVFARDVEEIGAAPELREFSIDSALSGVAAGLITNEAELGAALQKQIPGAELSQDPEGNALIKMPSGGTYALNKPGLSGQDFIQFTTRALGYVPAGRAASVIGAAGKSALTEGGLQAVESAVGGEFNPSEVALSAATGGAFKKAEQLAGKASRLAQDTPNNEIVEAGRNAGIPTLTSDIVSPQTFAGKMAQQTSEKIPFSGTGSVREGQQELRTQAVERLRNKYSQFSHSAIVDSLKNQKSKIKSAAGNTLNDIGQQLDNTASIKLRDTDKAISSAISVLEKPGVIKSPKVMADIENLITTLREAPQTFTSLKENRTLFREVVKGADSAERTQLASRTKALLTNIEKGMSADMRRTAKQNLSSREFRQWQNANRVYAEEAEALTKTRIKNVLDKGDLTPEAIDTMIFSKKPSEVKSIYQSLGADGKNNARSAIISKVFNNLSSRQSGITPNSFATEMKKFGLQTETFFKGEEKKSLNGLMKALNATRRAQDASITTPTGQQLLGAGTLAAAVTDLGATVGLGGTVGGLARLYESAAVRNALLKLNSASPRSEAFERALRELDEVVLPVAQSLRSEQSGRE